VSAQQQLEKRRDWLKQKLAEMRRVGGPDYTPSVLLQGRVQGQIGELDWLLSRIAKKQITVGDDFC
jgi:hypothetical protein